MSGFIMIDVSNVLSCLFVTVYICQGCTWHQYITKSNVSDGCQVDMTKPNLDFENVQFKILKNL